VLSASVDGGGEAGKTGSTTTGSGHASRGCAKRGAPAPPDAGAGGKACPGGGERKSCDDGSDGTGGGGAGGGDAPTAGPGLIAGQTLTAD
jgi:hypothetical protein